MRGSVNFHSTDKRGIRFIHNDESRAHFLENSIVHVSIVGKDKDEMVVVVQLEIVIGVIFKCNL